MKLFKMSIVALSMGLFLASCGGTAEATVPAVDSVVVKAPMEEVVAVPVVDSVAALEAQAAIDSAAH